MNYRHKDINNTR